VSKACPKLLLQKSGAVTVLLVLEVLDCIDCWISPAVVMLVVCESSPVQQRQPQHPKQLLAIKLYTVPCAAANCMVIGRVASIEIRSP
jgi:hypothetical protein